MSENKTNTHQHRKKTSNSFYEEKKIVLHLKQVGLYEEKKKVNMNKKIHHMSENVSIPHQHRALHGIPV